MGRRELNDVCDIVGDDRSLAVLVSAEERRCLEVLLAILGKENI